MAVFSYFGLALVVITFLGLGASQRVYLRSNDTDIYACTNEYVQFECSSNSSALRWEIPELSLRILVLPSPGNDVFLSPQGIKFETTKFEPLTSIFTIHVNDTFVINSTTVMCDNYNRSSSIPLIRITDGRSPSLNFHYDNIVEINSTKVVFLKWNEVDASKSVSSCINDMCSSYSLSRNASSYNLTLPINVNNVQVTLMIEDLCSRNYSAAFSIDFDVNLTTSTSMRTMATDVSSTGKLFTLITDKDPMSTTKLILIHSTTSTFSSSKGTIIGTASGACVFVIAVILFAIILILLLWKFKGSHNTRLIKRPEDLQNVNNDGYSVTRHNQDNLMVTYNTLDFKQNKVPDFHSKHGYADLQLVDVNSSTKIPQILPDVVYSGVQVECNDTNVHPDADKNLNLDMLLIQLSEIEHLWSSYGSALGIPAHILTEIDRMSSGFHDKFVEVLDYWLYMHSTSLPATWKEVAKALNTIGCSTLASKIMEVYITGNLPVTVDMTVTAPIGNIPPPIPPKEIVNSPEQPLFENQSTEEPDKPPPLPPKMMPK